jgi:hypothetical protein
MGWSGRARAPPAIDAGRQRQKDNERLVSEDRSFNVTGEWSFRNASIDGGEMTLWVNNCLADHRAARQLDRR